MIFFIWINIAITSIDQSAPNIDAQLETIVWFYFLQRKRKIRKSASCMYAFDNRSTKQGVGNMSACAYVLVGLQKISHP